MPASLLANGESLVRKLQMILSKKPYSTLLRRAQAILLTGVLFLLPLGIAGAQEPDWDAISKRMREAVAAEEITGEQARVMLGALRKTRTTAPSRDASERDVAATDARDVEEAKRRRYYEAEQRVEKAVEAGRVSEEDGRKRLAQLKEALWSGEQKDKQDRTDSASEGDKRRRYKRAEGEIKKLVAAGRMSEEQGEQRLAGLKKDLWGESGKKDAADPQAQRDKRRRYMEAETKIDKMVASGKVTEEQGEQRLAALKEKLWGSESAAAVGGDSRMDQFQGAQADMAKKVAAGKMTQEQADARLARFAQKLWGGGAKDAKLR